MILQFIMNFICNLNPIPSIGVYNCGSVQNTLCNKYSNDKSHSNIINYTPVVATAIYYGSVIRISSTRDNDVAQ